MPLKSDIDCIVLDLDNNLKESLNKCIKHYKNYNLVLGAISMPTKSSILKAKDAGCLMVLTKSNFSANLLDILNKIQ